MGDATVPRPVASRHPRPVKCDLSRHPRPTNHKDSNQKRESSSSYGGVGDYTKEQELTEPRKMKMLSLKSQNSPMPKKLWYEVGDMIERAAKLIEEAYGFGRPALAILFRGSIEIPTVTAILRHMNDLEDLRLWLTTSRRFHASANGWGRLVTDAAHGGQSAAKGLSR
jgi:hypothetical protein